MNKNVEWRISRFEELSITELYAILYLRCQVFVVEQDAPYLDVDNKDQKALHLHGYLDDELVAYCRLFQKGDYFEEASIGRVVVEDRCRRFGFGHQLMTKALELMKVVLCEDKVTISGQLYLEKFYESHGFKCISDVYLEDGLPHIRMKKE